MKIVEPCHAPIYLLLSVSGKPTDGVDIDENHALPTASWRRSSELRSLHEKERSMIKLGSTAICMANPFRANGTYCKHPLPVFFLPPNQ